MVVRGKLLLISGWWIYAVPTLTVGQVVNMTLTKFSDGETRVQIDENVRGADCFVVQSTVCHRIVVDDS